MTQNCGVKGDCLADRTNPHPHKSEFDGLKIQSIRGPNKKTVIASDLSSVAVAPLLRRVEPQVRVAISSLQQPKPHFVSSSKSLQIDFADLHTRGPPPFVIPSAVEGSIDTCHL